MKRYNLRTEQPHLWQRVLALSLVTIFMGLPLLAAPSAKTPNANVSVMQELLPLHQHAWIFIVLGLLLLVSVYFHKKNYQFTRISLSLLIGYALMWMLSLIYGALTGNLSSFAIVSLWGFYLYIILNTLKDPGFKISNLIREVRGNHRV